jgi:hypothetical protein
VEQIPYTRWLHCQKKINIAPKLLRFLHSLRPLIGSAVGLGRYHQMLLQVFCVFSCHLAEFEAEFVANLLLLHIRQFSRSVQLQNSTDMMSRQCADKT